MNRLVIIRVGEQYLWQTSKPLGLWSSPESHAQHVRHLFVEGYNVIALFVGRGDIPLAATRITGVRERILEDSFFPQSIDLGGLWTFLQFDPTNMMNLEETNTVTHTSSINYIKYTVGSQIPIPVNISRDFINYFINMTGALNLNLPLNTNYIVPNNVNYII
jgi:hypothetical protein